MGGEVEYSCNFGQVAELWLLMWKVCNFSFELKKYVNGLKTVVKKSKEQKTYLLLAAAACYC
jgi:hypothetical protein